jgi:hypothetical protein
MHKSNPPFPKIHNRQRRIIFLQFGLKAMFLAVILTEETFKNNKRGAAQ